MRAVRDVHGCSEIHWTFSGVAQTAICLIVTEPLCFRETLQALASNLLCPNYHTESQEKVSFLHR